MVSLADITAWAAAGESETLEFKRTAGQRREAAHTLCAMLNHRGGRVLFGVEPDGRVSGQRHEILDQTGTQELGELTEYANRFHHDTNPAWETEVINDAELRSFVERALAFARR